MRSLAGIENKLLTAEAYEHKAERCPTGEIDREIRVRRLDGGTHGVVPTIDVRNWKRSPSEISADAFVPTAQGITTEEQFAASLIEAIAKAAGLVIAIASHDPMSLIRGMRILGARWFRDPTLANYPASPGGQVPTLQADGTVVWHTVTTADIPDFTVQPAAPLAYSRREAAHLARAGANAFDFYGQPTATGAGSTANADDADGAWIKHSTTTTLDSLARQENFSTTRKDREPEMVARVKTDTNISDIGLWVGLFSPGSPGTTADPAGIHLAAFRYHTSADGTAFWRTVTKDGTTINAQASSQSIAVSTMYLMRIDCRDSADVKFYINGTLVGTHTTNLPALTQPIGWGFRVVNKVGGAGSTKSFNYGRIWYSHK